MHETDVAPCRHYLLQHGFISVRCPGQDQLPAFDINALPEIVRAAMSTGAAWASDLLRVLLVYDAVRAAQKEILTPEGGALNG